MRYIRSTRDGTRALVDDNASPEDERAAMEARRDALAAARVDPQEGVGFGGRMLTNAEAGVSSLWHGAKQTFGYGPSPEEHAEDQRARAELRARDPYFAAAGQFIGEVAPFVAVAPASIPGMMFAGAAQGLLSEQAPGDALRGKLTGGFTGGLAGGVLGKGAQLAGQALPRAVAWGRAKLGMSSEAVRDAAAREAFAGAAPQGAEQTLRDFRPATPGAQHSTAQILADPQSLQIERTLRSSPARFGEAGTQAAQDLSQQRIATNEALFSDMERHLAPEPSEASHSIASQFWEGHPLTPSPSQRGEYFQGVTSVVKHIGELEQRTLDPRVRAELAGLREQLSQAHANAQHNPELGMEQLHKIRRLTINDTVNRLSQQSSGLAKELTRILDRDIEPMLDNAIERSAPGWKAKLAGYAERKGRAGQIEKGEEFLGELRARKPLATGAPSVGASAPRIRAQANKTTKQVDRYGRSVMLPEGQAAIERASETLNREGAPQAADINVTGSPTGENLLTAPGNILGRATQTPAGAVEGAMLKRVPFAGPWLADRQAEQAQAVAGKLLTLYGNPKAALAALERSRAPITPEFRSAVMRYVDSGVRSLAVDAMTGD